MSESEGSYLGKGSGGSSSINFSLCDAQAFCGTAPWLEKDLNSKKVFSHHASERETLVRRIPSGAIWQFGQETSQQTTSQHHVKKNRRGMCDDESVSW